MYNRETQHTNPSRVKIPYHLCNRRIQASNHTSPSEHSHELYRDHSNLHPKYYDQMSDENRGLRSQLEQLKRFNLELRRRLQNRQRQLEQTDREFKEVLLNYNRRLEASNVQMASVLMQQSREFYRDKQKSRSRSKSKLLAIKKELRSIDCGGMGLSKTNSNSVFSYQK